jgi:redox-sensitive bicupin YhaK (pirin superfamily)
LKVHVNSGEPISFFTDFPNPYVKELFLLLLSWGIVMRTIQTIIASNPTIEGAGVKLKRVFGYHNIPLFDPFLLLDHFGSENPADYVKGFPWHPHRGIETVTYMVHGEVAHGDSIGNTGVIRSGDIQWMTAGSGIIHQEMPQPYHGTMMGFQLWVNLSRDKKMTGPRYQGLTKKDMVSMQKDDAEVNIIAGKMGNKRGPVRDLYVDVEYFDVHLSGQFIHSTSKRTVFLYVYDGSILVGDTEVPALHAALLGETGDLQVQGNAKFLYVAGNPLKEPIAWGGPIVMNTDAELTEAFRELDNGTFIKGSQPSHIAKDYYR